LYVLAPPAAVRSARIEASTVLSNALDKDQPRGTNGKDCVAQSGCRKVPALASVTDAPGGTERFVVQVGADDIRAGIAVALSQCEPRIAHTNLILRRAHGGLSTPKASVCFWMDRRVHVEHDEDTRRL
jgi:hypothetical protein